VKIHVLADAEAEMESARQYLEGQRDGLGSRFLDDLSATLAAIADRPLSFANLETLPDGQPYRRALLRRFSYAIIFEVLDDKILVVAIAHSSRAPSYWLRRRP
jgi:plasmid stabilization system protein ParE